LMSLPPHNKNYVLLKHLSNYIILKADCQPPYLEKIKLLLQR
jgi:hypothetical protein